MPHGWQCAHWLPSSDQRLHQDHETTDREDRHAAGLHQDTRHQEAVPGPIWSTQALSTVWRNSRLRALQKKRGRLRSLHHCRTGRRRRASRQTAQRGRPSRHPGRGSGGRVTPTCQIRRRQVGPRCLRLASSTKKSEAAWFARKSGRPMMPVRSQLTLVIRERYPPDSPIRPSVRIERSRRPYLDISDYMHPRNHTTSFVTTTYISR